MTPPKKTGTSDTKVYVEIGPNLKHVLLAMVGKVYNANHDATYYKMAFDPIYQIIKKMIQDREHQGEEIE